jgi:hypothetical protein
MDFLISTILKTLIIYTKNIKKIQAINKKIIIKLIYRFEGIAARKMLTTEITIPNIYSITCPPT